MATTRISAVKADEHNVFGYGLLTYRLPRELDHEGRARFEELWSLRPERFHEIT